MNNKSYFYLKNNLSELIKLEKKVKAFCKKSFLSTKICYNINLVCEEIFVNIVMYDKHSINSLKVKILLERDEKMVVITIKDNGSTFNPLKEKKPSFEQNLANRETGGFGIFLVQKWASSLEYRHKDSKNILIIKKEID